MAKPSEDQLLQNAIADTEKELFSDAMNRDQDLEENDRSLEESADELDQVEEVDSDEQAEDGKVAAEDAEGDGKEKVVAKDGKVEDGKTESDEGEAEVVEADSRGRVPSGKLREANERARKAEAELATFKAELKAKGETDQAGIKALSDKLDSALRRIDDLTRAPKADTKPAADAKAETIPDPLEDPKGYAEYLRKERLTDSAQLRAELATERFNSSLEVARERDAKTFDTAWAALNSLDRNNPSDQATVQSIVAARNPGAALLRWHRNQETLREVGDDPAKFKERIAAETREALLKDPEFRKQLLAGTRSEAEAGDDGNPRTVTRLPRSAALANGGNGSRRGESDDETGDDSDPALFQGAFAHRARA
jgi:hypothetical protein